MKEVKHRVWDKVNSEWLKYTCRTKMGIYGSPYSPRS